MMFAGRWPVKYIPGWPHSSNQSDSVGIARENSIAIPTRPLHVVEAQDQSQRNMSVTAASSGRGVPIRFLRRLLHGAPASTPTRWRRKGGREGLRRCRCAGADADAPFEPPGTAPNPRFLPQLHSPSPRRSTGRSECGKRRAGCCRPGAGPGSPGDPTRRRAGLRPTVSGWEPRPPRRPPAAPGSIPGRAQAYRVGWGAPAAPQASRSDRRARPAGCAMHARGGKCVLAAARHTPIGAAYEPLSGPARRREPGHAARAPGRTEHGLGGGRAPRAPAWLPEAGARVDWDFKPWDALETPCA